jgi:hypothetical protein
MCPACLAATVPVIAGAASGSAALAFVAKKLRDRHRKRETTTATEERASPKGVTNQE